MTSLLPPGRRPAPMTARRSRNCTGCTPCSAPAFLADPYPDAAERQALLGALAGMLMAHRERDPGRR